uniref:Uncharacterized protein n=1 Tax=Ditylum brightwellii TaxID=49249 RepID=A0A7S4VRY7_9STRA|mmetsp:Transcript_35293/g.46754  ORF Transcript_35293/g.46754 Transcript_35293/m.46754 type:complete len:111 (-) Transcript_35293:75-407(-)
MTGCQVHASAILLQTAQEYKPDYSTTDGTLFQKRRQAEESSSDKGRSSKELGCDFIKITMPTMLKKYGQSRVSTEYHILKLMPYFERIRDEIEMDDLSYEEDSEDENEED